MSSGSASGLQQITSWQINIQKILRIGREGIHLFISFIYAKEGGWGGGKQWWAVSNTNTDGCCCYSCSCCSCCSAKIILTLESETSNSCLPNAFNFISMSFHFSDFHFPTLSLSLSFSSIHFEVWNLVSFAHNLSLSLSLQGMLVSF